MQELKLKYSGLVDQLRGTLNRTMQELKYCNVRGDNPPWLSLNRTMQELKSPYASPYAGRPRPLIAPCRN